MNDTTLTVSDAFHAIAVFLEEYWKRTGAEDIGALLGDLQLDANGQPFDPAVAEDWSEAVRLALFTPR